MQTSATSENNKQSITFNGPSKTEATVRSTGTAMVGGFSGSFSSDYCGATAQAGVGMVGFAFSAGGPVIDQSCVMLRVFERTQQAASSMASVNAAHAALLREASLEILGLIDPKVRNIFVQKGLLEAHKPIIEDLKNPIEDTKMRRLRDWFSNLFSRVEDRNKPIEAAKKPIENLSKSSAQGAGEVANPILSVPPIILNNDAEQNPAIEVQKFNQSEVIDPAIDSLVLNMAGSIDNINFAKESGKR